MFFSISERYQFTLTALKKYLKKTETEIEKQ